MKKVISIVFSMMFVFIFAINTVKAINPYTEFNFWFDFSTNDYCGYSGRMDKWTDRDVYVGSASYSELDFTATVVPDYYLIWNREGIILYPGDETYISVPWFNDRSDSAVVRGESNYDIYYFVQGGANAEPGFYYPED